MTKPGETYPDGQEKQDVHDAAEAELRQAALGAEQRHLRFNSSFEY